MIVALLAGATGLPTAVAGAPAFQLRLFRAQPSGGVPTTIQRFVSTDATGIDLHTVATLGTVRTAIGTIDLYGARSSDMTGVLVIHALGSRILGGGSSRVKQANPTPLRLFPNQGSDLKAGPEIPGIVGPHVTRVRILFADRTSAALPLRSGMFDYVVGGVRCQPSGRPIAIQALDAHGTVAATDHLTWLTRLERDAPPGSGCDA